jgi:hypothetical protein
MHSCFIPPYFKNLEKTIALPLIGEFDTERADRMITAVLKECASNDIQSIGLSKEKMDNELQLLGKKF